jgi:predicted phosphodiesterase
MRIAILSDVHGNLIALEHVIRHAHRQVVDAWWFLGDVVGYGPRPLDCLLALDALPVAEGGWLMGNHDKVACLLDPLGGEHGIERQKRRWQVGSDGPLSRLMPSAESREIAAWHAEQLRIGLDHTRLKKLKGSPAWNAVSDDIILAHGAVLDAPDSVENLSGEKSLIHPWSVQKAKDSFFRAAQYLEKEVETLRLLVVGHTHVPVLLRADVTPRGREWRWENVARPSSPSQDMAGEFSLGAEGERWWAVLNPGSVGQPRDEDPRASYAILDTGDWKICFYQVDYPIRITQADMIPFYPEAYRLRLEKGE